MLGTLFFQGCTSYYAYDMGDSPELAAEITLKAQSNTPKIRMHDGYGYSGANLDLQPDSSQWYAGDGVLPVRYPTSEIYTVTFTYRKDGAKKGLIMAGITGLVVGALLGYAMDDFQEPPDSHSDSPAGSMATFGAVTAVIFGIGGALIGWTIGDREVYRISIPESHKESR